MPVVTGPATAAYTITYAAGDLWLGARLRPASASAVWGERLSLAADSVLRGDDALHLVPALGGVGLSDQAVERLCDAVPATPDSDRLQVSDAIQAVHHTAGRERVQALAESVGCSTRHLYRQFREHVGLSVKVYSQLVQFHVALQCVRLQGLSLTDTAITCGYADQPHMARAFKRFGGVRFGALPDEISMPHIFNDGVRFLQDVSVPGQ